MPEKESRNFSQEIINITLFSAGKTPLVITTGGMKMNDSSLVQQEENSSRDSSVHNNYFTRIQNTPSSDTVKIVAIVSAVLLLGFIIYAIFFRSSIISINVGVNNTITNTVIEDKSTSEVSVVQNTPQPTAEPVAPPASTSEKTASKSEPGLFQRIGAWFGWLFTTWLPKAIVDVFKFLIVDVIWGFLVKTVLFGILQFLWNLLVSLWRAIFG